MGIVSKALVGEVNERGLNMMFILDERSQCIPRVCG